MPINTMAMQAPYTDYGQELEELQRRQRYAEMLREQSMQAPQPPETKGRLSAPTHWTQLAAGLLKNMSAQNQLQEGHKERKALSQRYQDESHKNLADALMKAHGRAGQGVMPTGTEADQYDQTPYQAPVPPDPMGALGTLAKNPNLALQSAGTSGLVNAMMPKKPEFAAAAPGSQMYDKATGAFQGPQVPNKPAEHVIGGKVYQSGPQGVRELGGPGVPVDYNKPFKPDGTPNVPYQQFENEKAARGATRVQTNVNAFTPASEEAQRDFIKSTRTTYDQIKQAPIALESIERAKALVPSARGFMGTGGETLLEAAKFLNNRIGTTINVEGVKSAEELRTRIFFNIMDNLKKMDAQPSQQQQQIMQEALGKLGTDPNALPQVLDAFGSVIKGKVALHNAEVQSAIQRGVKFPYDPIVKIDPEKPAEVPQELWDVMTPQEKAPWLKRN